MSVLRRPVRRLQQPQDLVEINWGNPLAHGLVVAWIPGNTRNLVDGAVATLQGARTLGKGGYFQAATGTQRAVVFDDKPAQRSESLTTFARLRRTGTLANNYDAVAKNWQSDGDPTYVSDSMGYSPSGSPGQNNIRGIFGRSGGATDTVVYGHPDTTLWHTVALTAASSPTGVVGSLYVDGLVRATVSVPSPIIYGASGDNSFGTNVNGKSGGMDIEILLRWNRALSASEVAEVTANPWQLFRQPVRRLFVDTGPVGAPDTTAPTLTSVSGTDTGSTSATVSASSTEAGPGWAVLTPTSTQPSQAQVEAGQDHTGSTTGVFLDTATLAIGANPAAFAFTGLTPGATYWPHVVAKDTATPTANVSAVESGPSFTMPAPDLTDPVFAGGTTLDAGTKTNSSIALSTSAVATDNIAVTGYEWSSDNGATYPFTSLTNSFTFTALADLTSYNFRVRAYDGAGNRSTPLSLTTSTYRAGGTGQFIFDNTGPVDGGQAGILFNDVALPGDANKWFSYSIVSQTLNGGTLMIDPQGRFTFTGASSASFTYQLEVDGANFGSPVLVTLYNTTTYRPTSDVTTTGWTSTGANFFGVLDESPSDDADFVTSPDLAGSPGSLTMGIASIPSGQKVARFRARRTATVGEMRQVFLDAGDAVVGTTAWVALTGSFALYQPTVFLTGTATKVRIEVRG